MLEQDALRRRIPPALPPTGNARRKEMPSDDAQIEQKEPRQPLSNAEVDRVLRESLPDWKREELGIRKRFRRATFLDAVAFVNQVADLAEAAQHHPDIDIRWRNVTLRLTTHEAGGVTDLDLDLARRIEELG
jgi:4a-hydroxytetrahydrobiopterin dehydratase